MRASIIVAAHNEGQRLWKTLESIGETCDGLDYELIVADDASTDGSVNEAKRRFPRLVHYRNEDRCGASPTKALGADHARGDTLVFLDGHTKPELGSMERLIRGVELSRGKAIVTPQIAALDDKTWQSNLHQTGHGYATDLETLDVWWLSLKQMKSVKVGKQQFYESPALIGCAFAISRELYGILWGFDKNMLQWGAEDLDFGLKCWLMGYRILHDPTAIVGHRFQNYFSDYTVAPEHLVVNQLRTARKHLTESLWDTWVERAQKRTQASLDNHPEGLWAHAWEVFQSERPSVEHERSYLLGRRKRDELWYAKRFELSWPVLGKDGEADEESLALPTFELRASPNPCNVQPATNFAQTYKGDSATLASELHVPTNYVLAVAGDESAYGTSNAATGANNYFGLHAGAPGSTPWPVNPIIAQFPASGGFMASGRSFVQIAAPLLVGLPQPITPTAFYTALSAKWGIGTPNYVQKMVQAAKMAAIRMNCPH